MIQGISDLELAQVGAALVNATTAMRRNLDEVTAVLNNAGIPTHDGDQPRSLLERVGMAADAFGILMRERGDGDI